MNRLRVVIVGGVFFLAGCWVIAGLEDRTLLDIDGGTTTTDGPDTFDGSPDGADAGPTDSATSPDAIVFDAACEASLPNQRAMTIQCTPTLNCSVPATTCCPIGGTCADNDSTDCLLKSWICTAGAHCAAIDGGPARCCGSIDPSGGVAGSKSCPQVVSLGNTSCQTACGETTLCDKAEVCPKGTTCRPLDVASDGGTVRIGACL